MAEPVIEVRDLVRKFGHRTVLNGITFTVEKGDTMIIMGGSGCGKSTLLRHIIGSLRPTSGSIKIFGRETATMTPDEMDKLRQRFGMNFQFGALLQSLTVGQNVALPLMENSNVDAGIIDLAQRHMHLREQHVETHVEDAYQYLARTTETFDAILDDLFLTGPLDVVRSRTPKGETMALLRAKLAPGGLLVANLITDVGEHAAIRQETRAAFLAAFASVRVVEPPQGLNEILVGGDQTLPGSALGAYVRKLSEPHDRQRMREILVKPLRRPRSTDDVR